MQDERPSKRARNATACTRCKHRKQRCDNGFPACAACSSAGQICHYENRVYRDEHVKILERRVVDLEHQLRQSRQQLHQNASPAIESSTATTTTPTVNVSITPHVNGEADAAFDMLSSTSYLGTSSGFPLARTLQAAIGPSSISPSGPTTKYSLNIVKSASPDNAVGLHCVETYLHKVHPKHAFLPPRRISDLHRSCQTLASSARPIAESTTSARIDFFVLHLVYAIGARYMQLSQSGYHCNPEAYYAAAIEDVECLFESRSLESLEGMLLLCIFQLRSPSRPGIWSMIGTTMRHALMLGLHRRFKGSEIVDQRRKRIFWTIYMLERSIARTLGLPVCVSDRDVELDLPANVPEDIEDETEMRAALEQSPGATPMSASIHIFRLAQLESKIYSSIHRVDRPATANRSRKVDQLRQLLEAWKNQIPDIIPNGPDGEDQAPNSYTSPHYHVLHYHRVMLLLLLPNLTSLAPTHPDFHLCVSSAGQVAQLYKKLHDHQNILSYSLIALHATFVAGLTLIFCFLASDGAIFTPQFSSNIRACSTVLYIISERWPAARKVRDAFERMVSLTVERDEGIVGGGGVSVASVIALVANDGDATAASSNTNQDGSSRGVDGQTETNLEWNDLTAQIPRFALDQESGGSLSDPNGFWNCLGPWLGDEADSLGQGWGYGDFEGLGSSTNISLMQNSGWNL